MKTDAPLTHCRALTGESPADAAENVAEILMALSDLIMYSNGFSEMSARAQGGLSGLLAAIARAVDEL